MRVPLTAFGIVAVVIIGFVLLFTNYNQSASSQFSEVIAAENIDECYDETMNSWFIEFNNNQESGASMSEADEKASEKALSGYDNCIAQR